MKNEFFNDEFKKVKKSKKRFAAFAVMALILAGVAVLCAWWALSAFVHTRAEVPVPDVSKKSVSNALDLLAASNLALKKAGGEVVPDVPPGFVIRQIPAAGNIVREGRVIRVWVSEGVEVIQMPNLVGMPLRDAQLALRQAGLTPGATDSQFSLTHEKGLVTAQSFPEEAPINKGDVVNLTVSNGPPAADMLLMPDFRQKKLTDATRWASASNIELDIEDDPHSPFPGGTITAQAPAFDEPVSAGSTVRVTVSRRAADEEEKLHRIHYELAQGKNDMRVRIVVIDETGEREVFNENKAPGSKIDLEIPYGGEAKVRIYVNNILVREREMK